MKGYIPTISFNQAKKIAEQAAFEQLEEFIDKSMVNLLEEEFVEAECCWFFFRNKQIEGPP